MREQGIPIGCLSHYTSSNWQIIQSFEFLLNNLMLNSLWHSDAIWRHRSWSTLAQVTACCLMAPSHYLDKKKITWTNVELSSVRSSGIHLSAILQEMPQPSVTEISLKIIYLKFHSNLPGASELNSLWPSHPIKDLIISSDDGWVPDWHHTTTWNNADLQSLKLQWTQSNEIQQILFVFK